ncbi:CinA family protein [Octadecabacter sp. 1_MG-2023]|uniref:CinA family protein n=1 Tax=unclassified Octadecabacter TaxID=196158 RepID=UPI001C0A2EA9|nr:CinA family protein [Octadecabacter sp. 1_MG-2023]MBU2993314.1 CinA family protein [Octadecabacter sp. B2R22]MDO6733230.1 CinA family protein [Octadecabacter sp. 1_MG-2023]
MSLAQDIVERAIAKGVTLTTAESCTGGMVSAALTDIAGSSAMFERGFVTYSNAAKVDMLGVETATLDRFGAVSEEVAAQMANGARNAAKADIAVSITGIAGPGPSEHKPEGRVCFGVATADGVQAVTHDFGALGRAQVRTKSVQTALDLLNAAVIQVCS